jgi:hypothetical protein
MRFVPVKSAEQQALLAMHRVRQGFIVERTAIINRLRGLMSEFGVVLPLRSPGAPSATCSISCACLMNASVAMTGRSRHRPSSAMLPGA